MLAVYSTDPDITTWWGTLLECASAIARLEHDGGLGGEDADAARSELGRLARRWREVAPSDAVRQGALRSLRVHRLRAGDAVQLASALAVADQEPEAVVVVCLDSLLADALRREGFTVEAPAEPR